MISLVLKISVPSSMILVLILLSMIVLLQANSCDNSCSGHGFCLDNGLCKCYDNWGIGLSYNSGDCSERICPFESAWVDSPDRVGNHHKYIECSAKGICNRDTGECECFPGYEGKACSRTTCPNECSGHGQCVYINKLPYKTVIGDYNNYLYLTKYAAATGSTPGIITGASIIAPEAFIAKIFVNNRVVVGTTIYYAVSADVSSSSFKISPSVGGTAMDSALSASATELQASSTYTLIALPPQDLRSVTAKGSASGLLTTAIPHGLSVGDIIYLSGISSGSESTGLNNVLYGVASITSPFDFTFTTLALTVGGQIAAASTIVVNNAAFIGIKVNVIIPNGALTISAGVASVTTSGQFDVVDPYIDSLTSYIDKRYWDAKKTRGCVCDPEYGAVDCSLRMCQHGTDVMNTQKDFSVTAKNHIQLVSLTGQSPAPPNTYQDSFNRADGVGKSFALTFKSKLNETFTTIPLNLPYFNMLTPASSALSYIRSFELDVEWALKTLPNAIIDDVRVHVTKPVDTTGVKTVGGTYAFNTVRLSATNALVQASDPVGTIGGVTIGHNTFEFSVEFTGSNVQGTQHYLIVEDAKCGAGCFPRIDDGLPIDSVIGGNTYVSVVTQPTFSAGMDNDMESDYNSYECGRRGKCDYKTGLCTCFSGYTGLSCNVITALI